MVDVAHEAEGYGVEVESRLGVVSEMAEWRRFNRGDFYGYSVWFFGVGLHGFYSCGEAFRGKSDWGYMQKK